jgi:tRNA-dihydrouridine synthase
MVEHTELFVELLPFKNLAVMKKHYKAYVKDFAGASELRASLMEQDSVENIKEIVENFLFRKS